MSKTTKVSVNLDTENYKRFQDIYRMRGAITWFMNSCLESFVQAHEFEMSPDEVVEDVVDEVLQGGVEE